MFGGNSTPPVAAPAPPPPPANAPTFGMSTMNAGKRNNPIGMGMGSTILTSGAGLTTPASTARKTLLGQ